MTDRPLHSTLAPVTLREITADTVRSVTKLAVREDQMRFVASNAVSLAQALFTPEAWYRAIYLGEEPVGFVMLFDESLRPVPPQKSDVGVWRFMIDAKHQHSGVGTAALKLVIAHVRAKDIFEKLELSYVPEPGCPEPFYRRLGFSATGIIDDGEIVMALPIGAAAAA